MILYHGSTISGFKTLKPFPHNAIDGESAVFASSDIRFALAMIHGTGNDIAVGYYGHKQKEEWKEWKMYIDELQQGKLQLLDSPGIIYEVDSGGFISDPRLCHAELINPKEVKILQESRVPSVLSVLRNFDINIVQYDDVPASMKERGMDPIQPEMKYKDNRFD